MKQIETAKLMAWMLGAFPQWKPDVSVAPTWASELPDIDAETAKMLVRKIQARRTSPFPPSVFEIMAEDMPRRLTAHDAWNKVRQCFMGMDPELTPDELTVIEKMGGISEMGESRRGDTFTKREFFRIWDDLQEEKYIELFTREKTRQLSEGRTSCGLTLPEKTSGD